MRLEARPDGIRAARRLVASVLVDGGLHAIVDVAVLLTSELVTNSLLHGGPHDSDGEIALRIGTTAGTVRVEAHDNCVELPTVGAPDGAALSGRGMLLIEALASAWGTTPDVGGKWVWFEVQG